MELRPILSAMLRNRTGAVLVALQVAITMAVLVNAAFIINDRMKLLAQPAGVDVDRIITILIYAFDPNYDWDGERRQDLDTLRNLPGVEAATTMNSLPLSDSGWSSGWLTEEGNVDSDVSSGMYMVDEFGLETLGMELLEGRWFRDDEVKIIDFTSGDDFVDSVIVTETLAKKMFPGESAVGKPLFLESGDSVTIVGVTSDVACPWPKFAEDEVGGLYNTTFLPGRGSPSVARYVVRAGAGEAANLAPAIEKALTDRGSGRVVMNLKLHREIVDETYGGDIAMIRMLVTVIVLLLVVTSLGVVGLASFNVRSRTKQIGTRRAVGARRRDILRYFLLENAVMTGIGVALGTVLTFALNLWLVENYDLARLDPTWVPLGILGLLLLGQIATLAPARRASLIPPAVATRTI
jgi:putative ABC transport system permease protein